MKRYTIKTIVKVSLSVVRTSIAIAVGLMFPFYLYGMASHFLMTVDDIVFQFYPILSFGIILPFIFLISGGVVGIIAKKNEWMYAVISLLPFTFILIFTSIGLDMSLGILFSLALFYLILSAVGSFGGKGLKFVFREVLSQKSESKERG